MKVTARVQSPDDIEVEIVTTMTLYEWSFVLRDLSSASAPASELVGHLQRMIALVRQEFQVKEG